MIELLAELKRERENLRGNGWDVSHVSIGLHNGLLRVCDGGGAYDFRESETQPGRILRTCCGLPSKATEWIANGPKI